MIDIKILEEFEARKKSENYQQGRADEREDAIDEFLKIAIDRIRDDSCGCADDAKKILKEIAEQMKEGKI